MNKGKSIKNIDKKKLLKNKIILWINTLIIIKRIYDCFK